LVSDIYGTGTSVGCDSCTNLRLRHVVACSVSAVACSRIVC
jgi:hypothetical protein